MLPLSVHLTAPVLHAVKGVVKNFDKNIVVPNIISMLTKLTLSLKRCLDDIVICGQCVVASRKPVAFAIRELRTCY
jgi:hypothetical protein